MRVSDGFSEQPKAKHPRLYNGVITSLEIIKILGLIGSAIFGTLVAENYDAGIGFITFLTSAFTIYISMTSCVAIIDLLSRIEHNTRKPQLKNSVETDR
jgi:hypothetical protein